MNSETIEEGHVRLHFAPGDRAAKYDDWAFFRHTFRQMAGGSHGVDAICVSGACCWLIEIKSLARQVGEDLNPKITDTIRRAAIQTRDTLAGLAAAAASAKDAESRFAKEALRVQHWRVALHLQQADRTSRMHPTPYDRADATQKLRQLVRPVDSRAVVVDTSGTENPSNSVVPWTSAAR